jgi:hypothetical protein
VPVESVIRARGKPESVGIVSLEIRVGGSVLISSVVILRDWLFAV